jgi:hypothetical protein
MEVTMTASLRKGARGAPVRTLQEALRKQGFAVTADGVFGSRTDIALRNYQINQGLLGDGIAGPRTLAALGIAQSPSYSSKKTPKQNRHEYLSRIGLSAAQIQAATSKPISQPSQLVGSMRVSETGLRFIYTLESQKNRSNHLHWPGNESGVTLGSGYDLRHRKPAAVIATLKKVGIPTNVATLISEGVGLHHENAEYFCIQHHGVKLEGDQEMNLLRETVPAYEKLVHRFIQVELMQYEFDALVSVMYNPGRRFDDIARFVNFGQIVDAMKEIKTRNTSGGNVMKGLVNRRESEINLYLFGEYGQLRYA